jgi:hypothetical protein
VADEEERTFRESVMLDGLLEEVGRVFANATTAMSIVLAPPSAIPAPELWDSEPLETTICLLKGLVNQIVTFVNRPRFDVSEVIVAKLTVQDEVVGLLMAKT